MKVYLVSEKRTMVSFLKFLVKNNNRYLTHNIKHACYVRKIKKN